MKRITSKSLPPPSANHRNKIISSLRTTCRPRKPTQSFGSCTLGSITELKNHNSWNNFRNGWRRRLSSASSRPSSNISDSALEESLQERMSQLSDDIDIPYGEFTLPLWQESCKLIEEMAQIQTPSGFEYCCTLMDRLVIEADHLRDFHDGDAVASSSSFSENINNNNHDREECLEQVTTETLNSIVRNWSKCWEAKQGVNVTPPQMLAQMDDWICRLDNSLHPDVKTYGMIIKAAINFHTNPKIVRSFVESLFERMIQEADTDIHPNVRPDTMTYATLIPFLAGLRDTRAAENYLNQMLLECAKGNSNVQPTAAICNSILSAYDFVAGHPHKDPRKEAPYHAEKIFRYMQHLHESGTLKGIKPNLHSYLLLLQCWGNSKHPNAPNKSKELYYEMKHNQDSKLQPNHRVLERVIKTMAAQGGHARDAQDLLYEYLEGADFNKQDGGSGSRDQSSAAEAIPCSCFQAVLAAWCKENSVESVDMAENLINRMRDMSASGALKDGHLRTVHYNKLFFCLAKHLKNIENAGNRADLIVKEMEEQGLKPDKYTFDCLIAISAMGTKDPHRAENTLEQMYEAHLLDGGTEPDTRSFNHCLHAWAKCGTEQAPERADSILRRMWKLHETGVLSNVRPDTKSYSIVMGCHVNARHPNIDRCLELFEEMQSRSIPENLVTNGICLNALARAGRPAEAEDMLDRVIEKYKGGEIESKPDVGLFNYVLSAWSVTDAENAGYNGQRILDRMKELHQLGVLDNPPNLDSYTKLIKCWIHPKQPWERSERIASILHHLEKLAQHDRHFTPNIEVYKYVIRAYGLSGHAPQAHALLQMLIEKYSSNPSDRAQLDQYCFKSTLNAWSKTSDPVPEKAEMVLQQMIDLSESTALEKLEPGPRHLTLLLKCCLNQNRQNGGGTDKIEAPLRRFEAIADESNFNYVLKFYAELGNAVRAENLLKHMHGLGRKELLPSLKTYRLVLMALRNSDDHDRFERSEVLLREMYDLHEQGGYAKTIKPTESIFTVIMECYIGSNHPQVVEKVEALRDEMLERERKGENSMSFDNVAFHSVMRMYSRHGHPSKAAAMLDEICQEALAEGNEKQVPPRLILDSYSMLIVLRAWARHNNPERAEAILRRMCQYRDRKIPNVKVFPENFLVVATCWNQSQLTEAGARADDLLQMMELENQGSNRIVLEKGIYLETMKNLARVGEGERAEALLRRVQSLFQKGKVNTAVDLFLYRDVIQAWSQSKDPNASGHIARLEDEIVERFPERM